MAFESKDLSVLAYANNFTLWHYTTVDSSVIGAGYFNVAASMLRVNDLIIVNIDTDGAPSTVFYIVTVNSGSVVTIAAFTA
ncbi:MAG: hypothetical protein KDJ26_01205 [Alphaproteobacteria bacterium]|nr:hypothetical protein [Alphaproteobacteria bacterium]MCB9985461.1 hypothetical protein [Micavibrio sp.]HRK98526.1 hypothetical protein [Alphaproteobacteria bacterium]